jgi:hypothetical protein
MENSLFKKKNVEKVLNSPIPLKASTSLPCYD